MPVPYRNPDGSLKAPYATSRLELPDIVNRYPQSVYILGGFDAAAKAVFNGQIRYIDLFANEAYLIKNALLTAQGAVCAFEKQSDTALCDLTCIVTGYGRIARFLCRLLMAHGAGVIAAARKESDLELISAERMRAVHINCLHHILPEADVVFNTVPHHVMGEAELKGLRRGATLMELASPPYGADLKLAADMGVNVCMEQGIPGRYFPVSAARAMLRVFESGVI